MRKSGEKSPLSSKKAMKRFKGVLLVSDYDNTLVYTLEAKPDQSVFHRITEENKELLKQFMRDGGSFAVATGRGLSAFFEVAPTVPTNMPTILFNGGAIYDFKANRYIRCLFMDADVRDRVQQICAKYPDVSAEFYGDGMDFYVVQPNEYTRWHASVIQKEGVELASAMEAPGPYAKILMEGPHEALLAAQKDMGEDYAVVFSTENLLEITEKRATKGSAVHYLAKRWGIAKENLYCMGDQRNDLSMLLEAQQGFAPANANAELHRDGILWVSDCREHALQDVMEYLYDRYPEQTKE